MILDLLTRELGRVAVAAKGAKRPYSQLRSVLLPFQRLQVSLGRAPAVEAASDVQTLRGAEWAGGAAMLTGAALFSGFYLNELLMKLVERHDPHVELFDAYSETLASLAHADDFVAEAALRAFELRLLRDIGVLPDLSLVTLTQQPVQAQTGYTLSAEAGVASPRQPSDADLRGASLTGLQAALVHGSMPALQQACAADLPALKTLLRGVLQHHLGPNLLRTRQVMRDVQNLES